MNFIKRIASVVSSVVATVVDCVTVVVSTVFLAVRAIVTGRITVAELLILVVGVGVFGFGILIAGLAATICLFVFLVVGTIVGLRLDALGLLF